MSTIPRCRRSFGQSSLAPGWPDFESPGPFEPKRWSAGGDEPVTGDYTLNSPGFLQRNLPHSRRGKANALTILAAIAITIILSTTIPHFLRLGNILNILEQLSILGFMSIGMTFVMVSGGIDLSTYTIVSAGSVVGATAMVSGGYSPLAGCFLMVLVGLAFGSINGVAIAFGRMIPFIVTLSTMVVAQGFAIWFTQAQSISGLPDSYVDAISGKVFDVPIPAIIIIAVAVIAGVILDRTQYGRWLYLTGTNEAEIQAATQAVKAQLAFYASTPAYKPVLDLHGWGDLFSELNTLSKRGEWVQMADLIPADMLDAFAVTGKIAEIPAKVVERYGGMVTRVSFYAPYRMDHHSIQELLAGFRAS